MLEADTEAEPSRPRFCPRRQSGLEALTSLVSSLHRKHLLRLPRRDGQAELATTNAALWSLSDSNGQLYSPSAEMYGKIKVRKQTLDQATLLQTYAH